MGESGEIDGDGEALLIQHLSGKIKTFIDVGANVGEWSEAVMNQGAEKGFCFEPSSQAVARLHKKFPADNIVIRPVALSDQKGILTFYEEADCGKMSSLATMNRGTGVVEKQVEVSTLDDEFSDESVSIDLLKTDCEGWDLRALKGGAKLLERTKFIQFEYNGYWLHAGSSLKEAIQFLDTYGIEIYLIKNSGLHPFNYRYWGDFYRYANFFGCRKRDIGSIQALLKKEI